MVNTHSKCMRHSLHNHGCNCPIPQRFSYEQNKVIRNLYTKLKFSSPERKAVRSFMYKRTAEIQHQNQSQQAYEEILDFVKKQVEVHKKREGESPSSGYKTSKKKKQSDEEFEDSDESLEEKSIRPKRLIKRVKITNSSSSSGNEDDEPDPIHDNYIPSPPLLQEHIEAMFSNKIQSMHMVWILQANKRGIITNAEMDHLQFLPYNNQSPFFIITLFLVLYECLKCQDYEQAKMKWQQDGVVLFHELLSLMDRKNI